MNERFARALGALRREQGISQRQAARDLEVSQALLSHYENGIREPGLAFVVRACDYYGVSADYLLGRDDRRAGTCPPPPRETEEIEALGRALGRAGERDPALAALLRRLTGELAAELGPR